MTDPIDNKSDDSPSIPSENDGVKSDNAESASNSSHVDESAEGTSAMDQVDDELPDYEELTPELVEEEAIRGDFMLRWASIFLAVLFGFSQIADTRTLVHVRSGDELRASGFVPSGDDPFAFSLEGQGTANVSWLFDHVVSLAYSFGGPTGLTIFKAMVAGLIAYLLSLISVRGMPTWWSSICCVLAICAASIDFLPVTDLATLLGLVIVLSMLHRHQTGELTGAIWKFPVLVAVWANLDSRAYIGVFAITLFAMGLNLRRRFAEKAGNATGADAGILWKASGVSALALLINPSPVESILSVWTTYGIEYPSMKNLRPLSSTAALIDGSTEYFPIWVREVLKGFEFAYLLGISTVVVALIVLLISRDREDLPWTVTLLGFAVLACLAMRELPLAALVAAAAAGTSAQRWYARTFRQEYTTETMEVLFSRGGRALTVLAMAFLGFCVVADRLPTRTPVGLGFDKDLQTTIDTLETQLAELSEDARILPTKPSQGDLLIWHGKLTYIDSRARLFGQYSDETSTVRTFDNLRRNLLVTDADQAETDVAAEPKEPVYDWQSEYEAQKIDYVMLRFAPPGIPNYSMVGRFLNSPDWILTHRGPSAAFFSYGNDTEDEVSLRKTAFESGEELEVERFDFARKKDFYQEYLYKSRPTLSAPLRDAQHFIMLDSQASPQYVANVTTAMAQDPTDPRFMNALGNVLAGPLMTIRKANEALAIEPQNATAHRTLGMGYMLLNQVESTIMSVFGGQGFDRIRYMQAVMALRQATVLEPDSPDAWNSLISLYEGRQKTGLALECLEKFLELEEDRLIADPQAEDALRRMYESKRAWEERRDTILEQVAIFLDQDEPEDPQDLAQQRLQMITELNAGGHTRVALDLAEENVDILRALPQAELLRGEMLLEAGQLEDGYSVLNQLAAIIRENKNRPEFSTIRWHDIVALSHLAKGGYKTAIETWNEKLSLLKDIENTTPQIVQALVRNLPLVPQIEGTMGGGFGKWPLMQIESARVPMDAIPRGRSETSMFAAVTNIESGNIANARFGLQELVSESGQNKYQILAQIYLSQIMDDAPELIADATMNPFEDFEFPEYEAMESATTKPSSNKTDVALPGADANASDSDADTPQEAASPSDDGQ